MAKKIILILYTVILLIISGCATAKIIPLDSTSDYKIVKEHVKKYGIEFPYASSYPKLYFNGDEVRNGMIELINRAEDYIIINSFLIINDEYGNLILEALRKKYGEGINVYVISDSSSRFIGKESGFSYLHKNQIPYVEYNPIRPWKLFPLIDLLYRDHRKYWIIDGKYVLLGGCNIINTSLQSREEGGNTDGMVLIESPGVAEQLLFSFIEDWNRYSSYDIRADYFNVPEITNRETNVVLFNQEASEKEPVIEFMINSIFAAAEKEVWIIQPYTFVNEKIIYYVEEMEKRGVEVNIVLSGQVNYEKFHYASYYGIKDLIDAGADVWIYSFVDSALHFKVYIIDDKIFSIGSSNFNKRSMELAAEADLLFSDRKSFDILCRSLNEIKKSLRRVTPEEAAEYRSWKYRKWNWLMQNAG